MKSISTLLAVLLTLLFALSAATETNAMNLDDQIPRDSSILYGTLPNGIVYYIRYNPKPEKRAELRLVVNAGSVLEDEDQQGLAHFVEHMAFNGTEHFEKQELIDYLESIGMRFGPDLNAYTSFDETVYMLQVPTDSVEMVEKGFQILEDWAHGLRFDPDEIDKERGVIIEEWRLGRGAEARMRDKQFPILFQGSRYAERLPIGKKEIVENAPHETLTRFYEQWYRPDLMAVIAVGDFNMQWIEALVTNHFSKLTSSEEIRERVVYPVPDHEKPLVAIATDPEATQSRVSIDYKLPRHTEETVRDYRSELVGRLYTMMLNQRLDELTREADPPYLYAYSGEGRLVRSKDVFILSAGVEDDGVMRGIKALLREARRVKLHGFTETELERQKLEIMRQIERIYNERDKTESRLYVAEYTRNFLTDEPIPGIAYERELYQNYVPGITLDEINGLTEQWLSDQSRVILVNSPEKPGIAVPDENEILAAFKDIESEEVPAYEDMVSDQPLVDRMPEGSEIIAEFTLPDIGVTQWMLANGVQVVLKPTEFKNDQILFTAFSPGGHSLVEDSEYISAIAAASIVQESGLGSFSRSDLDKLMAGKVVSVNPWIGELEEGLRGNASPDDIETLFQLIYVTCTEPRKDSAAYLSFKKRVQGFIENRSSNPEAVFGDTVQVTLAQHNFRARPWTVEVLEELDLDKCLEVYRERFADLSDFTFVFVGNIDLDAFRPLVQTYLGGLPSLRRAECWRDLDIEPPSGIVEKTVRKGVEPKGRVQLIFTGDFEWNRFNRFTVNSMVTAFRIKLREVLREDMGGTYGVGVSASTEREPDPGYQINISFGCDPDRVDELVATVFAEIDSLKTIGLDSTYVEKVKEMQRRQWEVNQKENDFWLYALEQYYSRHEDPRDILTYLEYVEGLDTEDIRQSAARYFDTDNYIKAILYPEEQ
jgi:zinc protease